MLHSAYAFIRVEEHKKYGGLSTTAAENATSGGDDGDLRRRMLSEGVAYCEAVDLLAMLHVLGVEDITTSLCS
jgi:hypothetical protein